MGSVGNPNPWTPYDNYRDCSQGICSIYCPQFCYLIFPPPPPSDEDSGTQFSPLIIAIIAVLTSAFLLVSYYTIFTRYCRRRNDRIAALEAAENRGEASDQWQVAQDGLDEELIKTITVCKYRRGDGLIEGTDCAVCLSEFQDNESLRLLPKCSHAFHLPCIDTWLKSQSNCPLCRANVVVVAPPLPNFQTSSALSVNSYEVRRPDDLVMVVDDQEMVVVHEENRNESDEGGLDRFRRSVSLGTFSSNRQLLISDILKFEEIDECVGVENEQLWRGVGSSKGVGLGLLRSPLAMEKSISSGGFVFRTNDKGENSILSN